ncbi:HNH endonuclease [Avibacterium endocarditidis]|uniref:HNH endonuclease n=1 Tax=Avibacterium endocarditidis TaxID=380674 RepID=UPI0039EFB5A6
MKNLKVDNKFTNEELCHIFKCAPQGGMRKSNTTNTLVLITKTYGKEIYRDRWENDIFYYTGMGLEGDQELNRQNKTLAESKENGVEVHLFENEAPNTYIYKGIVELSGSIVKNRQPDKNSNLRNAYIFPLKVKK